MHALWIALGEALGVGLSWMLIARRLKKATDEYDCVTIPDYLASRFNDKQHILRMISVVIILSMVGVYTTAQMVAAGKAFSGFLEMDYEHGVMLGALITLAYTTVGGFKAVAYTDVLQGLLMLFALIVIPVIGIGTVGGVSEMITVLGNTNASLLDPFAGLGWSVAGVIAVASFLAIGLPFLGVPQLMVRFMSLRDSKQVFKAGTISVLCILVFDIGAVLIGMSGRVLFPDLADAETILPVMSVELFPSLLTGVFIVVVLAAIMSTVDSLLLLASSAVVRDLLQNVINPDIGTERLTRYGKAVTVIIGLGAMLFALTESKIIFYFRFICMVRTRGSLCTCVDMRVTLAKNNPRGAVAGMLGGFFTTIIWINYFKESSYNLYEMIPAFLIGLFLVISVSFTTFNNERSG